MSAHPAEIDRIVAAEFVLGTLDREERRRVRARCAGDPQFAALVRLWERRLSPLHELAVPVTPPPAIWRAIAADLRGTPPVSRGAVAPRAASPAPAAMQRPTTSQRPAPGPEGGGAAGRLRRLFGLGSGAREAGRATAAERQTRRSHFPAAEPTPRQVLPPGDLLMPEGRTLSGAIRDAVAAGLLPEVDAAAPSRPKDPTPRLPPPLKLAPPKIAPPPARPRAQPEPLRPPPAFIFLEPDPPPAPAPEPSAPGQPAPEEGGASASASAIAASPEPVSIGAVSAAGLVAADVAPSPDGPSLQAATSPDLAPDRVDTPAPSAPVAQPAAALDADCAASPPPDAVPDTPQGSPDGPLPASDGEPGAAPPRAAVLEEASGAGAPMDGAAPACAAELEPASEPAGAAQLPVSPGVVPADGAASGPADSASPAAAGPTEPPSSDPAAGGEAVPLPGWAAEVASGEVSALPEGTEVAAAETMVGGAARRTLPWRGIAFGLAAICMVLGARAAFLEWYWPGGGHWIGIVQPEPLPVVVVRIDPDSGAVFVRSFAPAPPEGEIYRLWLVSPASGPRLLGAFSAGLAVRVPELGLSGLSTSELLVTREPVGRVATSAGGPGESVLYRGRLAPE